MASTRRTDDPEHHAGAGEPNPKMTVLIFSRDPGAANQMAALQELIRDVKNGRSSSVDPHLRAFILDLPLGENGEGLRTFTKDYAAAAWRNEGLDTEDWETVAADGHTPSEAISTICEFLRDAGVRCVITGAGDRDDATIHQIWRAARQAGIASAVFLDDDWVENRFTDAGGATVYPDRIFAISEAGRRKLEGAGIPADRVTVVGNLHLARLERRARLVGRDQIAGLRRQWGASDADTIVLFASQAWEEMRRLGGHIPQSEYDCLARLIRRIEEGRGVGACAIDYASCLLVIRPHPRESDGKFASLLDGCRVRHVESRAGESIVAILAADVIAGMTSIFLAEAEVLDKPVIRLVDPATFYEDR